MSNNTTTDKPFGVTEVIRIAYSSPRKKRILYHTQGVYNKFKKFLGEGERVPRYKDFEGCDKIVNAPPQGPAA